MGRASPAPQGQWADPGPVCTAVAEASAECAEPPGTLAVPLCPLHVALQGDAGKAHPVILACASARRQACGGCTPCPTAALLQKRKVESQPAKEAGGKRQPKALSAGFGFVECSTEASAKAAMRKLQAGTYGAFLSHLLSQLSWSRGCKQQHAASS